MPNKKGLSTPVVKAIKDALEKKGLSPKLATTIVSKSQKICVSKQLLLLKFAPKEINLLFSHIYEQVNIFDKKNWHSMQDVARNFHLW